MKTSALCRSIAADRAESRAWLAYLELSEGPDKLAALHDWKVAAHRALLAYRAYQDKDKEDSA